MSMSLCLRAELAALESTTTVPADRLAFLQGAFRRLAECEKQGEIRLSEWEQRCVVSAVAYFRHGNVDAALAQLRATTTKGRHALMPLMPPLSPAPLRDLLREVAEIPR
jgi:hypothetical protein